MGLLCQIFSSRVYYASFEDKRNQVAGECSAIRKPSQRQFLPAKFRFWIWLSQGAGAWNKRDCAGMLSMRQAKPSQVFAMRESATITSRGPRRGLGPTILAFVDSRTMRRLARDPGWLRRSHLDGESDESPSPLIAEGEAKGYFG